jgi:NAD(P) transhydrogenase
MSATKYDLIVIGSGPSGQRAAVAAAKMSKRVVVVEARSFVGGVCVNTGTIPSKTMREAVLHLSGYNYRALYGVNYRVKEKITMADLAFRVQAVIKTEVDVTDSQLSRNGIDVIHGVARLLDPRQVRVEGPPADTTLEADRIILAVGTRPATSSKVPINGRTIVNSDQILNLASNTPACSPSSAFASRSLKNATASLNSPTVKLSRPSAITCATTASPSG